MLLTRARAAAATAGGIAAAMDMAAGVRYVLASGKRGIVDGVGACRAFVSVLNVDRLRSLFSFLRLRFSPGPQRWQNSQALPDLQPSPLCMKAHGLQLPIWWCLEPAEGSPRGSNGRATAAGAGPSGRACSSCRTTPRAPADGEPSGLCCRVCVPASKGSVSTVLPQLLPSSFSSSSASLACAHCAMIAAARSAPCAASVFDSRPGGAKTGVGSRLPPVGVGSRLLPLGVGNASQPTLSAISTSNFPGQ
mmetsp:Transcript_28638/g.72465  ORF Transcript_28638/g.72465 Transcript_28638/m.72465 type:complete len:249 (-) Transcript_28638:252-998(-)